jgi:very-short-patch-repair endonuclease
MNAIEKRFFDAFLTYVNESPKASVHSESWEMKIAEYEIKKEDITDDNFNLAVNIGICFPSLPEEISECFLGLFLTPQESIGAYVVDFTLIIDGFLGQITKIAIEIDGHDFHERTKEQAGRDKRRDREISKNDYTVIRFTGSEIYTNSISCVKEAIDIVVSLVFERYSSYASWYIEETKIFDRVLRGEPQ